MDPQAGRLAARQVRSLVSSFVNLLQRPVDRDTHMFYTGLAFSLSSQTKNKANSEVWKPLRAPNLAVLWSHFATGRLFLIF